MTAPTPIPQPPTVHTVLCRVRDTMTPDNTCRGAEWISHAEKSPVMRLMHDQKSFHQHICWASHNAAIQDSACNRVYQGCLEALALANCPDAFVASYLVRVMRLAHDPGYGYQDCQRVLAKAIEATKPKPVLRKWLVTRAQTDVVHAETEEMAKTEAMLWKCENMSVAASEIR